MPFQVVPRKLVEEKIGALNSGNTEFSLHLSAERHPAVRVGGSDHVRVRKLGSNLGVFASRTRIPPGHLESGLEFVPLSELGIQKTRLRPVVNPGDMMAVLRAHVRVNRTWPPFLRIFGRRR
jgi:hypothetical protein